MALQADALSVTFDAVNVGVNLGRLRTVGGVTFWGTGLTPGQRLTLRTKSQPGEGSKLADYVTAAALDNADLWAGRAPQQVRMLSLDNLPVDGTWALTVFFNDGIEY
ncbi:MAG: hypothetical protein ACRD3C_18680 [Vicinamibacterales bacterium]